MEVGNLQRARWFWTEAIGLALIDDRGPYIAVGGHGGFAIGIEEGTPSTEGPEINVRVADVDEAVARLRGMGIEVEEPVDQPWRARHAWLHDPDGRRMSIYSTDSPAAAMTSFSGT